MKQGMMKAEILESLLAELYDDSFLHWENLAEDVGGNPSEWAKARAVVARRLETLRSQYTYE